MPVLIWVAATSHVGPAALVSQSRPAGPADVLRVDSRNEHFRNRFQALLDESQPSSWRDGWLLAEDAGSSVAPLLRDMWEAAGSRLKSRLLLMGAHSAAVGPGGEQTFGTNLNRLDDQEKVIALLILASGPLRTSAIDGAARLTDRREKIAVRVAAYLALSRMRGDVPGLIARDREEPGLLAAGLHAGMSIADRELRNWFSGRDVESALVGRGFLLAERQSDPVRSLRLARATEIVRSAEFATNSSPGIREWRRTAALCLARLGDPVEVPKGIRDPDPELTMLLASEPRMRAAFPLDAVPSRLADPPLRRRLAVLYVLQEPLDAVLAAAEEWTADAEIRGAMALALALRLLDEEVTVAVPQSVAAAPEGPWVQWAAGEPRVEPTAPVSIAGDAILASALRLALAGRLPSEAARRVLEDALWRSGSHPRLARVEARMTLIRDLLLAGSIHVGAALGISAQDHYLPAGIPRTDNDFFEIAYQFLQFAGVPRQIPESLRLR